MHAPTALYRHDEGPVVATSAMARPSGPAVGMLRRKEGRARTARGMPATVLEAISHRRRHAYRAGIGVPVLEMTAEAESFPAVRSAALYSYGLYDYGLYSYGLNSYGALDEARTRAVRGMPAKVLEVHRLSSEGAYTSGDAYHAVCTALRDSSAPAERRP